MGASPWQESGDGLDQAQGLFKEGEVEIGKVKGRQQRQAAAAPLRCPRCDSQNTKFCYYNNYSRSQPRHFCKSCRRHWTNGGTLRNVPVGGGRKNKRPKPCRTSSTGHGDQEHRLPTPSFAPDHLQPCPTLPRSSISSSSSDYRTTATATIDVRCIDGSNILGSLPCLPPTPPSAMTDPFYTSPSYYFSPFKRNRVEEDATAEEQDRSDGHTTSSYLADVGMGDGNGLFPLPTCGFADWNSMEPSSAGGDWGCWDELAGLPDLGRI